MTFSDHLHVTCHKCLCLFDGCPHTQTRNFTSFAPDGGIECVARGFAERSLTALLCTNCLLHCSVRVSLVLLGRQKGFNRQKMALKGLSSQSSAIAIACLHVEPLQKSLGDESQRQEPPLIRVDPSYTESHRS